MPAHTPAPTHSDRRRPALIAAFLALLVGVAAMQLLDSGSALGQTKAEQLESVRDKQTAISGQLEASKGAITELMGQISDARSAEAEANSQLSEAQAKLADATQELDEGRAELDRLRKEYEAARVELEKFLLQIYKSPTPDLGSVLLNSSDIEDYEAKKQYYDRLQEYQNEVIGKAEDLKNQMEDKVTQLADVRAEAEDARDSAQAARDEAAARRADLEAREADLQAARAAHEAMLQQLRSREGTLQEAIQKQAEREAAAAAAATTTPDASTPAPPAPTELAPGDTATIASDGSAIPPENAPPQVVAAIQAANQIKDTPYVWGGGHGSFESSGYDCSGAVSYMLHGGGFLSSPLDSTGLASWGDEGAGSWITVYANSGHAYAVVAGLRWDTSGTGGSGPGWSTSLDGYLDPSAYTVRHPSGF
jgi:cell wall-associated NlpC family hydrolase